MAKTKTEDEVILRIGKRLSSCFFFTPFLVSGMRRKSNFLLCEAPKCIVYLLESRLREEKALIITVPRLQPWDCNFEAFFQ